MKIGVIGGGAAGFFAAIHAAYTGNKVKLFEKSPKVLSKVLVSGGGRCNLTQGTFFSNELLKGYPRGSRFLKNVFRYFSTSDTMAWFESKGVLLKTEADLRVFPQSDDSQTIVNVLLEEARKHQVDVMTRQAIQKVLPLDGSFLLQGNGFEEKVDRLIICSGGSNKKDSYSFLEKLGHSIIDPIPSLFTFNTPDSGLKLLKGISVPHGKIRFEGTKLQYSGPILITHWGISGPAVLKLSAFGADWLYDHQYKAKVLINWDESFTEFGLKTALNAFKQAHPKKNILKNALFDLPARLWQYLVAHAAIEDNLIWGEISKKKINKLIENLFNFSLIISGKTTFKEEFVTAGGVDLQQIDSNTMESKLIPGLFFAGEVIDVDGITGGYNFQAAWSTGFLAGKSSTKL
ncbi:NAD(P)/FAD-dependent oxidoreductase [Cyclobacterium sp.]|uniref:NAD(P)/FAD-dependent oxidoreductase n=1 Tax=Cyclobacterium sp. TaxID=1966343 RepID=UPI0019BE093B|nr:NAD(P)/FAD-dependent oxidoreductase [Cyclobacterium sp.]MBD3628244.1 NAD(P)/FAD-dependent oxidoreductase [Cyclobacterium sp.]